MHLDEINQSEMALFKKKLGKLGNYKGRGTELITVYIPYGTDRGSVMGQLTEEISQSSNIKSPTTRKNVQGALRKIINFLKQINFKIPKKGLVVFAGNVSEVEGRSDIRLFTIRPVNDLRTKLYWCDSQFHLEPLREMAKPSEIYGLVTIDKNEATIASLIGKKYEVLGKFTSGVAGKTRAGGQCLEEGSLVVLGTGNIADIKDLHNPLQVKSVDFSNFSFLDSPIKEIWGSRKKKSVRILTKYPRLDLTCSTDHWLFQLKNNQIEEVQARELKEGDFLLMPEKIKIDGVMQKLKTNFYNNFKIKKTGREFLVRFRKKLGLSQKEFGKTLNLHQATVSSLELGKFHPGLEFIERICKKMKISPREFIEKYCEPVDKIRLPGKLTSEYAQILGYLIGDGNIEKERLNFSEGGKETAEYYKRKISRLFNANSSIKFRVDKNYYGFRIYGKAIVRQILSEFPEIKKAKSSSIPQKILNSEDAVAASFLKGLFDAEGYVSDRGVEISMNNKKTIQQIQIVALRFGILGSVFEYDNQKNKYSNNLRFTFSITEKESLKIFRRKIGFVFSEKKTKLNNLIKSRKGKSSMRQIIVSGRKVRRMFEKEGLNTENFPKVSNFFRNERLMSKQTFKNSIMNNVKGNKKLFKEFSKILSCPILPVKINTIEKVSKPARMVDIETGAGNFIANGLIVHNSAKRFEHLREEAAQDFYKRISEKMNQAFLPYGDKLKGIIIGGPGITKNYFLNKDLIDHRLKKKIISTVDISYTDESGIREMVQRSEEVLRDTDLMKERAAVNGFLEEIAKDELAAYGEKEVNEALKLGKVKELLLSEGLDWRVIKFQCNSCGLQEEKLVKEANYEAGGEKCGKCGGQTELLEEVDYLDFMLEKASETGAELKIISTDTPEGEQFLKGFGGIGAILRYK